MLFLKLGKAGLNISIRVQPKSAKVGPLGLAGEKSEYLKWGVRSLPLEGKANQELIESFADFFKISKSSIELLKGATARFKILNLKNISERELLEKLKNFI